MAKFDIKRRILYNKARWGDIIYIILYYKIIKLATKQLQSIPTWKSDLSAENYLPLTQVCRKGTILWRSSKQTPLQPLQLFPSTSVSTVRTDRQSGHIGCTILWKRIMWKRKWKVFLFMSSAINEWQGLDVYGLRLLSQPEKCAE